MNIIDTMIKTIAEHYPDCVVGIEEVHQYHGWAQYNEIKNMHYYNFRMRHKQSTPGSGILKFELTFDELRRLVGCICNLGTNVGGEPRVVHDAERIIKEADQGDK